MYKFAAVCGIALFAAVVMATPYERVKRQDSEFVEDPIVAKLGLPSNATAIRKNIVDTFSCDGKIYGYYADVDNECQLFHVCYPVELADGTKQVFKWSFICPEETIFNQETMTCTFALDAFPCAEAPSLYNLNENFGVIPSSTPAKA